jgi:hypothetical protein
MYEGVLNLYNRRTWSASRLGHFAHGERAPDTHWLGGWVGPQLVWMPLPGIEPYLIW